MRYLIILLLVTGVHAQEKTFIALQAMDTATTVYILSTGGQELNPLLPEDNIPALVIIKAVVTIMYLKMDPPKKEMWLINILTATAVINNAYQIGKHQRSNHVTTWNQ